MEILDTFLRIGYISRHVQSFKVLKDLDKIYWSWVKDKTLGRISVLQHIHDENLPISSAFNARRK